MSTQVTEYLPPGRELTAQHWEISGYMYGGRRGLQHVSIRVAPEVVFDDTDKFLLAVLQYSKEEAKSIQQDVVRERLINRIKFAIAKLQGKVMRRAGEKLVEDVEKTLERQKIMLRGTSMVIGRQTRFPSLPYLGKRVCVIFASGMENKRPEDFAGRKRYRSMLAVKYGVSCKMLVPIPNVFTSVPGFMPRKQKLIRRPAFDRVYVCVPSVVEAPQAEAANRLYSVYASVQVVAFEISRQLKAIEAQVRSLREVAKSSQDEVKRLEGANQELQGKYRKLANRLRTSVPLDWYENMAKAGIEARRRAGLLPYIVGAIAGAFVYSTLERIAPLAQRVEVPQVEASQAVAALVLLLIVGAVAFFIMRRSAKVKLP